MVARALPPAAEKWLPTILEGEIGKRVDRELASKGSELVEKQVLKELRDLGTRRLARLFVAGLAVSVLVLAGATLAIIKFAPEWLG